MLHIIAAQYLVFKMSPPAYLSVTPLCANSDVLRGRGGANYASGGSGILDSTVSESNSSLKLWTTIKYLEKFSFMNTRSVPTYTYIILWTPMKYRK